MCPERVGGHMGPPLRTLTNGADRCKHLIRHGLRPCHLPLKGEGKGRAEVVAPHANGPSLSVGADVPIGPRPARPGGCALQGVHLRRGARCAPLQDGRQVAPSSGPAGHLPPRGKVRRHTGSFFVIARRAAGPTRQSVSPSKEKRIPTAPPGPRNDGAGAQCAPLQTAGTQKIIPNSSFLTPSSSQAPYPSLPPDGESSLIALLRLSPPNPRLPPPGFGGDPKMIHSQFSILNS